MVEAILPENISDTTVSTNYKNKASDQLKNTDIVCYKKYSSQKERSQRQEANLNIIEYTQCE